VGGADVLAQHLRTLALAGGFVADVVFNEMRLTHAYAALRAHDVRCGGCAKK
jgi:ATP-dependent helicase Lhr and Lhr-like helicase